LAKSKKWIPAFAGMTAMKKGNDGHEEGAVTAMQKSNNGHAEEQ